MAERLARAAARGDPLICHQGLLPSWESAGHRILGCCARRYRRAPPEVPGGPVRVTLILDGNIFYGHGLSEQLSAAAGHDSGATLDSRNARVPLTGGNVHRGDRKSARTEGLLP